MGRICEKIILCVFVPIVLAANTYSLDRKDKNSPLTKRAVVVQRTILGAVAGYFKGFADAVIMRLVDIVLSIPDIFLLITLVTIFKPGVDKLILIFCLTGWTTTARLVRGEFLSLRSREYA